MTTKFEAMADLALVEHLIFNMTKLPEKDREFATSMANSVAMRRYASEKQRYWLVRLCERSEGTERVAQKHEIGSLKAIHDMFDRAAKSLQHPAIVLGEGAHAIRLCVAGQSAKVPGSINVTTTGPYESRTWYGRITNDGQFTTSPKANVPDAVLGLLRDFAANPVRVAAEYGRRTGSCCFCARELRTKDSLAVGYGPICAEKYGLPWGEIGVAA
jgi:hypothetical protein